MSLLLAILPAELPRPARSLALRRLFRATAAALGCSAPPLAGLGPRDILALYASFTAQHVQAAIRDGQDLGVLPARLYERAYPLGRWCGRLMGVRTIADAMAASRILYGALEIDFRGDARGEAIVERCFFSQYYTAEVCRIMSAMDHGILAGLLGGGDFSFHARITEGAPCCRARLSPVGRASCPPHPANEE